MIYLLIITLIQSGVKIINNLPPQRKIFIVNSPEEAAILAYQNTRQIPGGFDITVQLMEVNLLKVTAKNIDMPKIEFKNAS